MARVPVGGLFAEVGRLPGQQVYNLRLWVKRLGEVQDEKDLQEQNWASGEMALGSLLGRSLGSLREALSQMPPDNMVCI
jgi:hypothetical protein